MAADNRAPSHMRTGLFYAIITYLMWGMLPLYFNLMADASPVEIVASRGFLPDFLRGTATDAEADRRVR